MAATPGIESTATTPVPVRGAPSGTFNNFLCPKFPQISYANYVSRLHLTGLHLTDIFLQSPPSKSAASNLLLTPDPPSRSALKTMAGDRPLDVKMLPNGSQSFELQTGPD